ncbi:hypothetical protein DH2020_046247 [Rehmannia glutinosa]|uniref:RING-type E3 ubiquitin transferase n=1 Tax=Rehmannia glutinosa TaxID=99300 RepID=A0ABR0UBV1_REHGL
MAGWVGLSDQPNFTSSRKYRSSVRNNSRPGNPEPGNFVDQNQGGPVLDHPIWYIRTVGFPQSIIDSISMFKYKKGEFLIDGSCDCSVCLSDFQENENIRLLPKCSHAFHVNCIDTWLRSHKNCPVCRAPILVNENLGFVETSTNNLVSIEENRAREVETDETKTENQLADILSKNRGNKKFRVLSDLGDRRVRVDQELLQPVRRSVSMDFSCASTIYREIGDSFCTKRDEGCSENKVEIVEKQSSNIIAKRGCKNSRIYRMIKSPSFGRSLEKGSVSMKRSFSFSGKRSLRKNSRSLESISIPELSIQNQSR